MISCYHDRAYAGTSGIGNSLYRLGSRRIYHGNKSEEGEIVFRFRTQDFIRLLIGKGENPESIFRKITVLSGDCCLICIGDRAYLVLNPYLGASVQKHINGTLGKYGRLAVKQVLCAHELAV